MSDRTHFVYRTFDSSGELLYIGCTKRIDLRWSEHRTQKKWMTDQTVRCRLQGPYTRDVARRIEKDAIRAEEPLHGWSPLKHREHCKRTAWINAQSNALIESGVDWGTAIRQAVEAADEWFPDPYAHSYGPSYAGGRYA